MDTALEYSTRVVQEGGRRCKKSTLNDLVQPDPSKNTFNEPASGRNYRPSFHENKPKTLVFSHRKRAFWACFRENRVYKFGYRYLDFLR
jgi:hypothetical protein